MRVALANPLLLAVALLVGAPTSSQAQADLAVYVDGLRATGGDLVVRLYRSPEGFPDSRRLAYREVREPVAGSTMTLLLDGVPEGFVAVVAFHDADGDGRVRLGPDGRPLDGVSAGNWRGGEAPTFEGSALRVGEGVAVARLRLHYP